MGIGWVFGVLFFAKELVFVAYLMTIFIAGQGIIIFILFVPLSQQVCYCDINTNKTILIVQRSHSKVVA